MRSGSEPAPAVLVLGIGNTVMGDDGVGPRVVQSLQRDYLFPGQVEVVDGGTSGVELLPLLEGKSHLIVVDAVQCGRSPGSTLRLGAEELPVLLGARISPHQMGLPDVLALARLMGRAPEQVVLIGVQPGSLDLGTELSPEVAGQLDGMRDAVLSELAALGLCAVRRSPPPGAS